ncbi:MAG: YeeE/YedE family protein [Paracoccus sp. (in: a-proteobacteria)]|uniref:YeeE/YedE family protein n=1 Tax=Paracoccus sp. TaxID=267 RepID=UPI0026DF0790|nr:YeeE/YedE family protein [Paracoccus sp. (in: a-proteobacteria)]MDO5622484.1 YeeE/YedE family protein [Paracoccus sp. (in: a-proteobacteria)]
MAVLAGLILGLIFGAAARAGRFCLLRGVKGFWTGDLSPLRAFALALAVGIAVTQGLVLAGLLDLSNSLPLRPRWSWVGLLSGGAIFGVGMVLANACGARSLVLAAGGNMRSVLVLLVMGLAAQASLTGVLAPLRGWIGGIGLADHNTLTAPLWLAGVAVLALLGFAWPLRKRPLEAITATIIGATIAGGWWAVYASDDPFDPRILTAISFIAPTADSLLYVMLSTGRSLGFGVALVGGTLIGAFVMALIGRDARLETFTGTGQTLRAISGGLFMGFGGVLAMGCSIGQGLSGVSTLSLASLVAFAGILTGIAVALTILRPQRTG